MVKQTLINYGAATIGNLPAGTTDRSVYVGEFAAVLGNSTGSCKPGDACYGTPGLFLAGQ